MAAPRNLGQAAAVAGGLLLFVYLISINSTLSQAIAAQRELNHLLAARLETLNKPAAPQLTHPNVAQNRQQQPPPPPPPPSPKQSAPPPPPSAPSPPAPPSPPPQSNNKPVYVEPVRDPSWVLVPDSEVPGSIPVLPGEGLLSEAITSLPRKGRGVLFNAIHKDPEAQRASKNIIEPLRSAKRMHDMLLQSGGQVSDLKVALFTNRQPWEFMQDTVLCRSLWPECAEFQELKSVVTHVRFYEDLPVPPVVERRDRFQTWPRLWLFRILASLHSPFAETLVVDSDVYACQTFMGVFTEFLEGPNADVAVTLAPAPFGSSRNYDGAFRPGFPESYRQFTERNLGLQVLRTERPMVQRLLALFRDVYVRQANNTAQVSIGNDQSAFREALFTLRDQFTLSDIPESKGCRHEAGCDDGCLVVHRHSHPEYSAKEIQEEKAKKIAARNAEREAAKQAAAAGD
eukprot:m.321128 g.321128  ORF g.321128 m.321128 type:complete len:457 (-) comp19708_c4_seq1:61-1431(-)